MYGVLRQRGAERTSQVMDKGHTHIPREREEQTVNFHVPQHHEELVRIVAMTVSQIKEGIAKVIQPVPLDTDHDEILEAIQPLPQVRSQDRLVEPPAPAVPAPRALGGAHYRRARLARRTNRWRFSGVVHRLPLERISAQTRSTTHRPSIRPRNHGFWPRRTKKCEGQAVG